MPAPDSILIIKPGSLGDIVHAIPALPWIRKTWPSTRVTWIVDQRWASLLEHHPLLKSIVVFPREQFHGPDGWARSVRWFQSLSNLCPDLAIDLQGLMRSALMARAARSRIIVGGKDAREGAGWLYHLHADVDPHCHAVERYRSILSAVGINTSTPPEFPLGDGTRHPKHPEEPYVLLHPYARGEGKSLTPELTSALCALLAPYRVVLAGVGIAPTNLPPNTLNLLGSTTLPEFVKLAREAAVVISVDSGPGHIAAAVNNRVLMIHTWSDPRRVGPYNPAAHIWQGGEIRPQILDRHSHLPSPRSVTVQDLDSIQQWARSRMESPPFFTSNI
jgi:ADP-heptose:LPS heptosyltransferase